MNKKLPLIILAFLLLTSCRLVSTVFTPPATATPAPPPEGVTPSAVPSPTPHPATQTALPSTPTTSSAMPFAVLDGSPLFSPAFLHADLGCAWMGAAGQVFDMDGKPISNLTVRVAGTAGGSPVDALGITGAADGYGPGGYEVKLADQAVAGVFRIELRDAEGKALTEPFSFETSGRCEQNLGVINFVQVGNR